MSDDVKGVLRAYILANHLAGEAPENLRDDTPLQTSGILDSLATMNIIVFIEKNFGVQLDVYDTAVERFDRVDQMAEAVARKRSSIHS